MNEDKAYHAAMYQQNSHKVAVQHLSKLIDSSPWSVKYLEARADCYEHMGMYDDAILDLRPTTKLINDNTQAWYKISTLHYRQGEIERSLETIRECLKLDQVRNWNFLFLIRLFKDHKTCKDHYKKVKKLNKYLVNANNEATENKWNAAFESLDSAQTANKDNIHAVNSEIAQLKCRGAAYMQQTENIDYCNK